MSLRIAMREGETWLLGDELTVTAGFGGSAVFTVEVVDSTGAVTGTWPLGEIRLRDDLKIITAEDSKRPGRKQIVVRKVEEPRYDFRRAVTLNAVDCSGAQKRGASSSSLSPRSPAYSSSPVNMFSNEAFEVSSAASALVIR